MEHRCGYGKGISAKVTVRTRGGLGAPGSLTDASAHGAWLDHWATPVEASHRHLDLRRPPGQRRKTPARVTAQRKVTAATSVDLCGMATAGG